VVADLVRLIRLRNEHPAFGGTFSLLDTPATSLHMRWTSNEHVAELEVDLASAAFQLSHSHAGRVDHLTFTSAPPAAMARAGTAPTLDA
jgi:sucrose phosphorylase